jgi:hypothetical protein
MFEAGSVFDFQAALVLGNIALNVQSEFVGRVRDPFIRNAWHVQGVTIAFMDEVRVRRALRGCWEGVVAVAVLAVRIVGRAAWW